MKINKGFTLIELLVVVLIIGILTAIAVPYYQESVEKSIMQEAIINLKAIAQANDAFFLANGRYANYYEINSLDISIPGAVYAETGTYRNRIQTKYFIYSPGGNDNTHKALAYKSPIRTTYAIYIDENNNLMCKTYTQATATQTKLCNQLNSEGHL